MTVMSFPSISWPVATVVLMPLLLRLSTAQISGCAAVKCPTVGYGQSNCSVGTGEAAGLGITTFNSLLSPKPLTWTMFVQMPDADYTMGKDFLLGTPPSINLTAISGSGAPSAGLDHACALFFEGISSTLRFPGDDFYADQGYCEDALTKPCMDDLLSQTRTHMDSLIKSTNDNKTSSVCDQLKDALQNHPPATCTVTSNSTWGSILARPLTGPSAATPINPSAGNGCHPTTGGPDYSLSIVATDRISVPYWNSTLAEKVLYGVTPIVTAVYGGDGKQTEVLMSCLKSAMMNQSDFSQGKHSGAMRIGENAIWNSLFVFGAVLGLLVPVFGVAL